MNLTTCFKEDDIPKIKVSFAAIKIIVFFSLFFIAKRL